MSDKKPVKVSLGTVISICIIFVLIIALGIMYYFGFINNKKITELEAQKSSLESKIEKLNKETKQENEESKISNEKKKEILRDDLHASGGYSFNITVDELTDALMKKVKDSDVKNIEMRNISAEGDWTSIGWFDSEDTTEVTGIEIHTSDNKHVCRIICTPAKYGSGDVGALTVPTNLYNDAKKILGSETEEWEELVKSGKIVEKVYNIFTGEELKTDTFSAGMMKVLTISQ